MKKQDRFKKILKSNRKVLLSSGFNAGTLSNWAAGRRLPSPKQRKKLSLLLLIDQTSIPHMEKRIV